MSQSGVLFDMDGVLVDSNAAHFEAFQRLGSELGIPFTREMLLRTVGMHNASIFPLWLGQDLSAERIVELALRKETIYRELAGRALKPIPGAPELARALSNAGFRLAVGSSGPRLNVELGLATLGVRDLFDAVVTGDDLAHGKPSPEVFLKAAAGLDLPPSRCLVIEDAPPGVEAALNAGMKVIAVTTSVAAEKLKRAHRIVADPAAISVELIRSLLES